MDKTFILGAVIGIAALIVLKYGVIGLEQWDIALHPERLTGDTEGPWKMFAKPLLGLFS